MSDADILARVALGDRAALGLLYDRYALGLLRYARRVDSANADDVVQTVFMRVLQAAARFDSGVGSARPWLFAITTRVLQERGRALRRWTRALSRLAEVERPAIAASDTARDLERGLSRLTCAKRSVLLLAEVEGFSCEEIAGMLSIPVGTVWTRLHHARRALRSYYDTESCA